jgi:hypothetical protein
MDCAILAWQRNRSTTREAFWPKEVVSLQRTRSMAFGLRETLVLGAVASTVIFLHRYGFR